MVKPVFLLIWFFLLPLGEVKSNKYLDVEARISKSGYVISFKIDTNRDDSKDISVNFDGHHLRNETIDEDNTCSVSLYANTGLFEYEGYKDLDLSYKSNCGETYIDSLSLLGFNSSDYSVENNLFEMVYVKENGIPLLQDSIRVIENENVILPVDLPTEANRLFYIDCPKSYFGFLEYELYIGETKYPLELVYDWSEQMFCLNCSNIQMSGEEGIVKGVLRINYFQYFHANITFSETFLTKRVLADYSNDGYRVNFGIYDA